MYISLDMQLPKEWLFEEWLMSLTSCQRWSSDTLKKVWTTTSDSMVLESILSLCPHVNIRCHRSPIRDIISWKTLISLGGFFNCEMLHVWNMNLNMYWDNCSIGLTLGFPLFSKHARLWRCTGHEMTSSPAALTHGQINNPVYFLLSIWELVAVSLVAGDFVGWSCAWISCTHEQIRQR